MKEGTKYYPLYAYLHESGQGEVRLTFAEIEAILDGRLPAAARRQRGWWSNRTVGVAQAGAWMAAGFHVVELDLENELVMFRKPTVAYHGRWEGDKVVWDGELIKALRQHIGLTQAELADKLGMRQQTISEWETGAYLPNRSSSKFLKIIAEQAEFPYK